VAAVTYKIIEVMMNDNTDFFRSKEINKKIPIPLYYQLKEILLEFINRSSVGSALPTEEKLCELYGISRPTARQAIRELEMSGNLIRKKGKGTFIAEPKINQDFLTDIEDFEERMKRFGYITSAKVLELKEAICEDRACHALKLPLGTKVYFLRRLIYANETPMVLALSQLPSEKFPGFAEIDFTKQSLIDIIRGTYGYTIRKVIKKIEAKIISDFEAQLFDVKKGSPVQYIETTCFIDDETPIEHTMERYRADKNQFSFTLWKNE
jgi:GntR family transcriptional regulator